MMSGSYFGRSSGRAKAPTALQLAGSGCIVADSFARTVMRNADEAGLPTIECPEADGDHSGADLIGGVKIITTGAERRYRPIGDSRLIRLRAGGLIELLKIKVLSWEVFA